QENDPYDVIEVLFMIASVEHSTDKREEAIGALEDLKFGSFPDPAFWDGQRRLKLFNLYWNYHDEQKARDTLIGFERAFGSGPSSLKLEYLVAKGQVAILDDDGDAVADIRSQIAQLVTSDPLCTYRDRMAARLFEAKAALQQGQYLGALEVL